MSCCRGCCRYCYCYCYCCCCDGAASSFACPCAFWTSWFCSCCFYASSSSSSSLRTSTVFSHACGLRASCAFLCSRDLLLLVRAQPPHQPPHQHQPLNLPVATAALMMQVEAIRPFVCAFAEEQWSGHMLNHAHTATLTSSNIAIRLARSLSPACEPLANMFCTASCRAWRLEMPGCSAMATCLGSSDTVSAGRPAMDQVTVQQI